VAASQSVKFETDRSSYSYQISGRVGSTCQSLRVQNCSKSRHAECSASNVQSARTSKVFIRNFTSNNGVEGANSERIKQGTEKRI